MPQRRPEALSHAWCVETMESRMGGDRTPERLKEARSYIMTLIRGTNTYRAEWAVKNIYLAYKSLEVGIRRYSIEDFAREYLDEITTRHL